MQKLSVVIPVYNEKETILKLIEAVERAEAAGLEKEIIIIDDFSTDGTRNVVESLKSKSPKLKILMNEENKGKGYSIRKGFEEASGDYIIIQDADLEYDPNEYGSLLQRLINGEADVVYGSRFKNLKLQFKTYILANKFLTLLSNIFTDLNLTDMETCYKCFSREALQKIMPSLKANRFDIEPEITAVVARLSLRIKEVPISYFRRSYAEGKKIGMRDGVEAVFSIIKNV